MRRFWRCRRPGASWKWYTRRPASGPSRTSPWWTPWWTTAARTALPGFRLSLGYAVAYLSLLVLLPLAACFIKAAQLTPAEFFQAAWTERARAAYLLTFGASLTAAGANVVLGLLVAWVLVRYTFPFKR